MRALVVAVIGSAIVLASVRAARRFGVRDRLPARAPGPAGLPAPIRCRLVLALDRAAVDVDATHAVQLWLAAIVVGAVLGFALTASIAGGAAAAAAVGLGGPASLFMARDRRSRLVAASVAPTVEQVASELRAGGTIATAVAGLAERDSALAADFARIDARTRLGAPLAEALSTWARERDAPGVDTVAGAFAMCTAVGGRAAEALEGLATSLRDRLAVVAEARALSAQARMSALVVGGAPLLYLAWSALADSRALQSLLATTTGRTCIAAGVALELLGVWWMRRIVRSGSFW